ncbi:MAG: hypothetical protein ACRD27_10090 [Terracidiphilus sp.]
MELEFKPFAQPGIVNFRLAVPKAGRQLAINVEASQLNFNGLNMPWDIAPNVPSADIESGNFAAFALCSDHHGVHPSDPTQLSEKVQNLAW